MNVNPVVPGSLPLDGNKKDGQDNLVDNFKDMLNTALDKVNKIQHNADTAINKFSTGEIEDIHQVMMAVEEANLALKMTIQVRNKILESYREIMRMQV